MIDGHMHLENGPLTKEYVLQFVEEAKNKGIKTIHILDHTHRFIEFEPIYADLREYEIQDKWLNNKAMKFKDHLITYIDLMKEIQTMDLDVEVKYGLEVCYTPHAEEYLREVLSQYKFDFLIGSIHSVDGILYDMGFSKELLFDVYDIDYIYKRYYELICNVIESGLFTQIGHLDQIKLFNYYPTYDLKPTYQKIAELLNKYHVKAENNTGIHYRYGHKDIGLNDELLQVLKDNHVEMITSSDAHKPSDVGSDIALIYDKTMN